MSPARKKIKTVTRLRDLDADNAHLPQSKGQSCGGSGGLTSQTTPEATSLKVKGSPVPIESILYPLRCY